MPAPTETSWLVTYRRKIRYSDTDAQGIVFNGNYFTYFDDTLTDLLELAGLDETSMRQDGYGLVTGRTAIDFKHPVQLGEVVLTRAKVVRVVGASVVFSLESRLENGDVLAASGEVVFVAVDPDTMKPMMAPPALERALKAVHPQDWEAEDG